MPQAAFPRAISRDTVVIVSRLPALDRHALAIHITSPYGLRRNHVFDESEQVMADDLFAKAKHAMRKAHAPYSNFPVGAALRTTDGRIFAGCNVEVVSFPEGWCAETTAIGHLVMDGGGRIAELAVVAERLPSCSPCGGCRQRIAEFASPDTKIHLCDSKRGVIKTVTMGELLPFAFQTEAIG